MTEYRTGKLDNAVAVIGMSGRWPNATTVSDLWHNIRDGVDSITRFSAEDLPGGGTVSEVGRPDYRAARSILEGVDQFDAAFFGILPREAELIDPQQRVFLECSWNALEDAGYDPHRYEGSIGVYAGCSTNTYFLNNICQNRQFIREYVENYPLGSDPTMLGAISDTLATRVSWKLNLRGPSLTIQTACSTSLVAVCQACQSLLTFQCDMALAGGVSITLPQKRGYTYHEGGMGSADGHCRPFDANARGTVFGSGAGVVLLKRLEEAIADGDHIYAIIRGFAVNNDGSDKVAFTAPSIEGQANAIVTAQALANVDPESIAYLEAHGTATPLGDPIEVAALTRAFRTRTQAREFCALGSVKGNVGHLEAAAGVTGLICAIQALVHRQIPPLAGFDTPNLNLDLPNSPFYINRRLSPWTAGNWPRRAGVSSFGVGGTNAHVVVEEAAPVSSQSSRRGHLILLSARSAEALDNTTRNLSEHLRAHPDQSLDSVAYTLQTGRRAFDYRRVAVCVDTEDAIKALESRETRRIRNHHQQGQPAQVVFVFPGQGSQYVHMGEELLRTDAGFRADVDTCSELLRHHLDLDLRTVFFHRPTALFAIGGNERLVTQPALFVLEYALARLWLRLGVQPAAMLGHDIGEFVAACLAGVFSLEDALAIVATRARLLQELPTEARLAVELGEEEVSPLLNGTFVLAAVNGPDSSVLAGPEAAITVLEGKLTARGISSMRLASNYSFPPETVDSILKPLRELIGRLKLSPPRTPFLSSVTGTWISAAEAQDPTWWANHCRATMRFSNCLETLSSLPGCVFLEVGPGCMPGSPTRQRTKHSIEALTIPSLPDASISQSDMLTLLDAAGILWLHGVDLQWTALHAPGVRRCSLPTYPFERKRCWVDEPELLSPLPASGLDLPVPLTETPVQRTSVMMSTVPVEIAPTIARSDRSVRLRQDVIAIFQDLSGLSFGDADYSTSFVEMGLDSLFLTQITQAIQNRFGLKITFRQLLDQESTIDKLAAYLDARQPPEPLAPNTPIPAEQPKAGTKSGEEQVANSPTGQTAVEAIIRDQLQVMSQLMARQLDLLRGQPMTGPPRVTNEVVPPFPSALPSKPVSAASNPATEGKVFSPYKPLQRGSVNDLTENQARALGELIRRYTTRTARSKESTQKRRPILADPRVASVFRSQWKELVYPIVTVRSEGCRLWDLDGNDYIDLLNGYGPILFGHSPSFVTDALAVQLQSGFELGPQTPLAGDVADLLCELTGNERASFCNTGSEAVMAALRLARTVTGRNRVVLFAGSYHGNFDEVLVKGITRAGVLHTLPAAPGIPNENVANVTVLDYGTPESLEYIRTHSAELAAVLVEPVQSRHPALRPVEFLREVRTITEASGTALIFDEIVTGFRCHPGGVQALFGIRADLALYGKVAGGGMPIGILSGKARFMDALDGGMWQYGDDSYPETGVTFFAGTFVRHPLALTASYAVLKRLKEEGPALQQALADKTANLVQHLNDCFVANGVPAHIEHFASWFYFSFQADAPFGSLLYYYLRDRGIHIQEGFPCFLTTAHSDADLQTVIRAFHESVSEMRDAGFWPAPKSIKTPLPAPVPVQTNNLPADVPLTESQIEILLSAQQGDEASCAFNEAFMVEMRGHLDPKALQKALQTVVDRHDCLRASIDTRRHRLRIVEHLSLDLHTLDHSTNPSSERVHLLERLIQEDAGRTFDLASGPLVRAQLIKWEEELHTLIFTSHHIVCDGWSTNVVLDESSRLYNDYRSGQAGALARPPSFREYALTEAKQKDSLERAAVATWWAEQFVNPVDRLELPTDRPRGAVKSSTGGTVRRTIGASVHHRIKRAGAQQGCTLFATMLTGFAVLLHRLTGQNDVVVGVPTAGQAVSDVPGLVGHCVNFLPLRMPVVGNQSIADLLKRVSSVLMDGLDHQNYTYGSLVRKLGLRRDPSRLPLVEVQFNLEQIGPGLSFSGLCPRVDACPKSFVNFDLFLNVVETKDGLILDCDYNRDLFDGTTIERWLGHMETLLEGLVSDPRQTVAGLPILDLSQRHCLLEKWNATQTDYPKEQGVHELIARQASSTPNVLAVVCGDEKLTYAQLEGSANRVANYLHQCGARKGDRVAICLDRSADMLIAVLGVLKAGAAYVPLDPQFPSERIMAVLEDVNPSLILSQETVVSELGLADARVVCLDSRRSAIMRESDRKPTVSTAGVDLAYVIYTSGSTGKPKGVQIPHRAVVNLLCSMARQPGFTSADALLAVTTLAFDISVLELLLPLSVGGRVIIAPQETTRDGNKLLALLEESAATVMQATPATWRLLLEAGWRGPTKLKILCGGEALSRDLANELLARSDSVWNMYGPTETTIWSSVAPVEAGPLPVRIGPPIANTEFQVLDGNGQLVPVGVTGELHIGGDGVALGYWNRAELTAEKFILDPFHPDSDKRLYRTGDLVRYHPDGTLEFLGRLDNQVKIHGFRIETGEVEYVLKQHPGVRDNVVVAREDSPGHKRLVAYVVLAPSAPATAELRSFLSAKLPTYMVPSVFVTLSALPLTPNGKIDRKGLPRPDLREMVRNGAATMARTAEERILAGVSMEVLQLTDISIDDSVFDLGADSIQVFQIVARANDAGLKVTPGQLLSGRSIASICAEHDSSNVATEANEEPKLTSVSRNRFRMKRSHFPEADNLNGKSGSNAL